MAGGIEKVNVEITGKDKTGGAIKSASSSMDKLRKGAQNAALGFGAAAAGMTFVLKGFIDAAQESQRTSAQLDAVIKSTGSAAGLTADEVKNMATELARVTTVGDDTIITGQNMLLTFTNIGKEVFPAATETMLDMATAMNAGVTPSAESLKGTAIQLGKALNDPIKGITALTRVGVTFTEEQKNTIAALVESGKAMDAQKLILAELAREFGGSARAATETFGGKMEQLQNRVSEVQEAIGLALIPILEKLSSAFGSVIEWMEKLSPSQVKMIGDTALLVAGILGAVAAVAGLIALFNPLNIGIALIVGAIILMANTLEQANFTWSEFFQGVSLMWKQFMVDVTFAVNYIQFELMRLAMATDEELQKFVTAADVNLSAMQREVDAGWTEITATQNARLVTQKEQLENELAAQLDIVATSTGAQRDTAIAAATQIETEGKLHWSNFRIATTAELEAMRLSTVQKMAEIVAQGASNGVRFASDFIAGLQSQFSALSWAYESFKSIFKPFTTVVTVVQNVISGVSKVGSAIKQSSKKAAGGPVSGGESYLIGEKGPEIFTPQTSGMITPNNKIGGSNITINLNGLISSKQVALEYADIIVRKLQLSNKVV